MMNTHYRAAAAMLVALSLATSLARAEPRAGQHVMLRPNEVKWGPCPPELPPGASCAVIEGDPSVADALFAIRARMPDHYRIPAHFHPTDEHLVVLSGVFNMGLGDRLDERAGRAMGTGSFMVMPKGVHHFAWTKGATVLQVYGMGPLSFTYVDPKDDPRNR
jgi:hypothetical protein